jgi:hypothetical protein
MGIGVVALAPSLIFGRHAALSPPGTGRWMRLPTRWWWWCRALRWWDGG